ncbi:MAG: hypothetical protein A2928_03920 [Candidatus Taylorbacteria bacterium RIFCSPLOWO2_01_FULL_45_15b]|uniref:Uncharacterized protein n=1 Tax=Candidatus Taylorbacteria bacterium RIFCSPLOWO2_01_FULL_45_15b TaxID=1802319 RepID=A0A1G2NF13_9BACT|nr:MAG: hypothetical protein A2928_03920 [Candidatus Taylorbacteria bacterium RIFCSPLOWO2_01_FULL_45_15b]
MYSKTKIDEKEEFRIRETKHAHACPVCGKDSGTIKELVKIGIYRVFRGSWPAGSSTRIEYGTISKRFVEVICPQANSKWHRRLEKEIKKLREKNEKNKSDKAN